MLRAGEPGSLWDGEQPMAKSAAPYLDTIDRIAEVSRRIARLCEELRPVSASISDGTAAGATFEKNNRLQKEIGRLDELREQLNEVARRQRP
jgi:hypothetical protein